MKETLKTIINGLLIKMRTFRGDWNQDDPSASNYISNRPFYTEHDVEMEVFPKTKLTSPAGTLKTPLIAGQTYKVFWNDTEYECVASLFSGVRVLGNKSLILDDQDDTGEPFFLANFVECEFQVYTGPMASGAADPPEEIDTLRITTIGSVTHKINKKYLPSMNYISFDTYQNLTSEQQEMALENVGEALDDMLETAIENATKDSIKYTAQSLTTSQQTQARSNIGAASINDGSNNVKYVYQNLSTTQKSQARSNIGAAADNNVVKFLTDQTLSNSEKIRARTNIGAVAENDAVRFDIAQGKTESHKQQARTNIGAVAEKDVVAYNVSLKLTDAQKSRARYNIGAIGDDLEGWLTIQSLLGINTYIPISDFDFTLTNGNYLKYDTTGKYVLAESGGRFDAYVNAIATFPVDGIQKANIISFGSGLSDFGITYYGEAIEPGFHDFVANGSNDIRLATEDDDPRNVRRILVYNHISDSYTLRVKA